MLVSKGKPEGHLVTKQAYRDYRLEAEYRFPGKGGNCGVLVHASKPRALYKMFPQSIEVQMNSGDAGDFWCIQEDIKVPDMEKRRPRKPNEKWGGAEGDARRILNLTDGSEKPLGQWNTMVIEARGRSITVWVNGDLVNNGFDATADRGKIAHPGRGHRGRVPQGRDRPAAGRDEVAVVARPTTAPRSSTRQSERALRQLRVAGEQHGTMRRRGRHRESVSVRQGMQGLRPRAAASTRSTVTWSSVSIGAKRCRGSTRPRRRRPLGGPCSTTSPRLIQLITGRGPALVTCRTRARPGESPSRNRQHCPGIDGSSCDGPLAISAGARPVRSFSSASTSR